jgi:hypothetical protein
MTGGIFFQEEIDMQKNTAWVPLSVAWLMVLIPLFAGESAGAILTVNARATIEMELVGYNGLEEFSLAKATVTPGESHTIDISYTGLAVLIFAEGQAYPVILGDESFTLEIEDPAKPPTFTSSDANEYFYAQLAGKEQETERGADEYASLMVRAKHLLDSSYAIRTTTELQKKKNELHIFVREHYEKLKHSDMVRRLVAQYFMMHEYVDYHVEGAPAIDIKSRYQQAVLDGVTYWLEILSPNIPAHEVLNYCVSLYYQRSMVTLSALIIEKYRDIAFCPGVEKETWSFPEDLLISEANGMAVRQLRTVNGDKVIAIVSNECPVSMVETVMNVRRAAQKKGPTVIVVPLEQLNEHHLSMTRMVSGGNILFVDDETWRKKSFPEKVKLPLFVQIAKEQVVEVVN